MEPVQALMIGGSLNKDGAGIVGARLLGALWKQKLEVSRSEIKASTAQKSVMVVEVGENRQDGWGGDQFR